MSDRSQGNLLRNNARLMNPHSEFLSITYSRYDAMRERVGEKRSKAGHIIRVGQQLRFTIDEYRQWVREQLGGEQGTARCFYCNAVLDIHTMVTDHRTPLSQGGAVDLTNLAPACQPCNDQKGAMRAEAFMQLLHLVNSPAFDAIDRTDCLGRLQSALKLAIKARQRQAQRAAQAERIVAHVHVRREAS